MTPRRPLALRPSRRRSAAVHRALAMASLRADSSLRTRLERYNHHMSRARALEAERAAVAVQMGGAA